MQQPLTPNQREDVLRRAVQLHSAASEDAEMVAAHAAAAVELQIPAAILAQAEVQVRLQAAVDAQKAIVRRQFLRRVAIGVALALVSGVALVQLLQPSPPRWFEMRPAEGWIFATNPETSAKLTWRDDGPAGQYANLAIDHFGLPANQHFFANLNLPLVQTDLQGHDTVHLKLMKRGNLAYARVYIEGDAVRWRSDLLPLSDTWQDHKLKFDSLEPQQRRGDDWHAGQAGSITAAKRLSVKFGWYVNGIESSGEAGVAALGFE